MFIFYVKRNKLSGRLTLAFLDRYRYQMFKSHLKYCLVAWKLQRGRGFDDEIIGSIFLSLFKDFLGIH